MDLHRRMAEESSMAPVAKVVGKFARPAQQQKDVVSLRSRQPSLTSHLIRSSC